MSDSIDLVDVALPIEFDADTNINFLESLLDQDCGPWDSNDALSLALENIVNSTSNSSNTNSQTPSGFSPENNSNHQETSNLVSQAVALPANALLTTTCLEIIAQPYYRARLRYRSDYEKNANRLGVLKTRNSNYQGPAIRIPEYYRNSNGEYYIYVSLVTVELKYNQTNLHYFHPYELEDPSNPQHNETALNAVSFMIQEEDCSAGIKSFPSLRIVKKRAPDLKTSENLRVFDYHDQNLHANSLPQLSSAKETIKEYNLDRSQLVFTIAKKIINNDQISICFDLNTTVFSEEMIEGATIEPDGDNDIQSPNEKPISSPSICRVYKYAPRYGFDDSHEDMVIFLTNKLEPKKYGDLQVIFECDIPNGRWSQPVNDLDIKDRMVSFKTPIFPYEFDDIQPVDVILRQNNRISETIKYHYLSTLGQCARCQSNATVNQTNAIPNVPNKRSTSLINSIEFEHNDVASVSENSARMVTQTDESHVMKTQGFEAQGFEAQGFEAQGFEIQGGKFEIQMLDPSTLKTQMGNSSKFQPQMSEPVKESSPSPITTSTTTSLPTLHLAQATENSNDQIMTILANSIESLFITNDYTQLLRLSRSFVKKSPDLLHKAIINNHAELLLKFISVATINILQQRNELGETVLLHAVRLNRIEIIKCLLERKNSEKLLEDIDAKDNNIFHIIASNSTSLEIFDLLINYLLEKSIDLQLKFDHFNQDHWTPLQLAIYKNNLLATKSFSKYFNINVHETKKFTGDNLIHLAVKYGDLSMVKYLIEEGQLSQQGNQSNLNMTPSELAQSLKRDDIFKYLNEFYPKPEINEDESSDDDDDDDD